MKVVKLTGDQLDYVIAVVEDKLNDGIDRRNSTLIKAIEAILEQLDTAVDE